jgi:ribosomal protein L32E
MEQVKMEEMEILIDPNKSRIRLRNRRNEPASINPSPLLWTYCNGPRTNNQVRRRFKGQTPMPKIGYGSNKKTKHLIPSGHKELLVNNASDLELLLMHNQKYAAVFARGVSSKKRIELLARAKVLGVK